MGASSATSSRQSQARKVSVIIPADTEGLRDEHLEVVMERVGAALEGAEIIIQRGSPVPLYNKARVCNEGARKAAGDVLIFLDSDVLHAPEVLKRAADVKVWGKPAGLVREENGKLRSPTEGQGGLFAFSREAFEKVGGWDERFEGWGGEDDALAVVAERVLGKPENLGAEKITHLNHEPQPGKAKARSTEYPNRRLLREVRGDEMSKDKMEVENTSDRTIIRAGAVFPPKKKVIAEISPTRLPEITGCKSLRLIKTLPPPIPKSVGGYVCECGFVAKSEHGLKIHKSRCKYVLQRK